MRSPQPWQVPNLLALDAVLAAVLWQAFFAAATDTPHGWPEAVVLGLSVWLTYAADRLLDVARHPPASLISVRHRFAWQHARVLWIWWVGILGANLGLALFFLDPWQLQRGCILLLACLAYTVCHQKVFTRFFPKELFVALIFASGTWIFLQSSPVWLAWLSFALLCFQNCLLISRKERVIDRSLGIYSLGSYWGQGWILAVALPNLLLIVSLSPALRIGLLSALAALMLLYGCSRLIEIELYRVLADAILVAVPLVFLSFLCLS